MTMPVTDPLRYWGWNAADRPAIVFDGRDRVTYGEFDAWTDNVAHHLVEHGLEPGDRVGIVGSNSLEWCAVALGALKTGAIVSPYNQRFVVDELAFLVDDSEPSLVFTDQAAWDRLDEVRRSRTFALLPLEAVAELRAAPRRPFPRIDVDADSPAVIVYTSGTTSHPKGVVFTHRTIHAFIYEWSLIEPVCRQGVRMVFVLSLAGCPGINWAVLHMLVHGGTLYLETGFEPETTLRRLEEERIQVFMGVPVLLEQLAIQPGFADADLSALEAVTVGGARVPVRTLHAWLGKDVEARQIYGMTELGGTSIANTREDAVARPDSVGRDSIFMHHRVVQPDGSDCDVGEPGEIVVRGPAVTPGYWRNEAATDAAIRDGWFHSGDVGVIDADGHLRMVDRMKDMIISGGYNIAPSEIERVINELPGVEEVAVIPVDDAKFGEVVGAIVKASSDVTADAVRTHCEQRLARYKVPSHIVLSEAPLPRGPSGKLAKRQLREQHSAGHGTEAEAG